jgi:hypothetical protein
MSKTITKLSRNRVGSSTNETIPITSIHRGDQENENVVASITNLYLEIQRLLRTRRSGSTLRRIAAADWEGELNPRKK